MVDALVSGTSGSNPVEVQVLSSAPVFYRILPVAAFLELFFHLV